MNEELERVVENMYKTFPRITISKNESQVGFRDEREDCGEEFINWLRTTLTSYANTRIQEFVEEIGKMKYRDNQWKGTEELAVNQVITAIVALSQKYISKDKTDGV